MPKTFYTERDIEDMFKQGVTSLVVDDNVALTDLARDKAHRLGVKLVREHDAPPSAPVRPYIAAQAGTKVSPPQGGAPSPRESDLHQRVRDAVIARLGNEMDPKLLDAIITRVLNSVGVN